MLSFSHSKISNSFITLAVFLSTISVSLIPKIPVLAETLIVDAARALNNPTKITVNRGLATGISFRNGETIDFILLSDQSRNTYTLNAPLDSGRAKALFLRQNEKIDFPGATTTTRPNLFVVTIDKDGNQKEYEFIITNQQSTGEGNLVVIEPNTSSPAAEIIKPQNKITTSLGEASPDDLSLGLETELRRGNLDYRDPTTFMAAEAIALLQQETQSVESVLKITGIPLSLLTRLGESGLAEKTRRRLLPLESLTTPTSELNPRSLE